MEIPQCITDYANSVKEGHPGWEVYTFAGLWGEWKEATVFLSVSKRTKDEWWESPIIFGLHITSDMINSSRDYLDEWENEFIERVGDRRDNAR